MDFHNCLEATTDLAPRRVETKRFISGPSTNIQDPETKQTGLEIAFGGLDIKFGVLVHRIHDTKDYR